MIPVKKYIAEQFLHKKFRFTCECIIPIDVIGFVNDYELTNNEIILIVTDNKSGKIIHIGLNAPSLQIESLN
jgi:hypothetical protein